MKFFLLLCFLGVSISIDCLDIQSQPVDWWVILKMPTIKDKFPEGNRSCCIILGDNFYYCDATDHCKSLS